MGLLANQTGNAQKAYVVDALTATVTTDLSRLSDAYVLPTATVLAVREAAFFEAPSIDLLVATPSWRPAVSLGY